MATWTGDELDTIGNAEELEIAPTRDDGTLRSPTTIWVVRVGDDLYIRSWRGRSGVWFGAALAHHEGRIWAGDVEKDVTFVEMSNPDLNDWVDDAYRAKYGRYRQYVAPMVATEARSTTLRLMPRTMRADAK